MKTLVRFVVQNARTVIIATAVITLFLAVQFKNLRLVIDPDQILPNNHPFVVANQKIENLFENRFTVVVSVTNLAGEVNEMDFLNQLGQMKEKLWDLKGIIRRHSISLLSPEIQNTNNQLAQSPVAQLLVSKDLRSTLVVLEFEKIPGGFRAIAEQIKQVTAQFESSKVKIRIGGLPVFLAKLENYSERMALFFPLALLIIGFIHYEAFRTRQALILPLVTALLAVIWSVGAISLLDQSFDVFNATTPIMILAIAAGHAVQILKRYYEVYEELGPSTPNKMVVMETMGRVGPVMVVACLIAGLGFLSLVVFEVPTVRTFGIFSAIGILSTLIIELTFIPALRALLPAPQPSELLKQKRYSIWNRAIDSFHLMITKNRKRLFIVFAFVTLVFAFGSFLVHVDNSQKDLFFKSLQVREDDKFLNSEFPGTNIIYVLISPTTGTVFDSKIASGLSRLQNQLKTNEQVGLSLSYLDLFGQADRDTVENDFLKNWVTEDGRKTKLALFLKTDSSATISSIQSEITQRTRQYFGSNTKVEIGGGALNGVALNEVMVRDKMINILQIAAAIFIISSFVFRSLVAGVFILIPMAFAILANFGVMGIFHIPLQIATALVSAIAVGIGADYGIYLSFRLREELMKGKDEAEAIKVAFKSAGTATLYVASAVAGGFATLILSWGFYVHLWMGLMISSAMLFSGLAALTIMPALILQFRPKFIFTGARHL